MTDWLVRAVESEADMELALKVRTEVFICEQSVPVNIERDSYDEWRASRRDVLHVLGTISGIAVAAGRVVLTTSAGTLPKIGRIAVLAHYRGRGFGVSIMEKLHQLSLSYGAQEVSLSAQCHAISFYESIGYSPYGSVYQEAGIDHRMMRRSLLDGFGRTIAGDS